jgi:hypothetical protein
VRALRPVHEITLSHPQWEVFNDPSRFRVVVAGRRFGKTYLSCAELARAGMSQKNAVCWYIAPTYRMAKEIAWDALKATIPRAHLAKSPNETELSVRLINGSKIALKGADNPDSLRGLGLNFVVPDEFAMLDKTLWEMVLEPALSDRRGRALFVGTPMGYNWAYDTYLKGIGEPQPGWKSWQFTTLQGGNVAPDEIEAKRSSMDPRSFRQEFEASFETLHGRVYDNFDRLLNVDASIKDTGGEILIGQDFNVNPMCSIIGVKAGDELHILDALEIQTKEALSQPQGHRMPRPFRERQKDQRGGRTDRLHDPATIRIRRRCPSSSAVSSRSRECSTGDAERRQRQTPTKGPPESVVFNQGAGRTDVQKGYEHP